MKVDENCLRDVSFGLVYSHWSSLLSTSILLKYHKIKHLHNSSERTVAGVSNGLDIIEIKEIKKKTSMLDKIYGNWRTTIRCKTGSVVLPDLERSNLNETITHTSDCPNILISISRVYQQKKLADPYLWDSAKRYRRNWKTIAKLPLGWLNYPIFTWKKQWEGHPKPQKCFSQTS